MLIRKKRLHTALWAAVVLVVIACVPDVQGQNRYTICDGDAAPVPFGVDQQVDQGQECYKLGSYPRGWAEAQDFCRRRGGDLANDVDQFTRLFETNNINQVWSGYYVQDGRLLQSTAASPEGVSIDTIPPFNLSEPFYAEEGDCLLFSRCNEEVPPEGEVVEELCEAEYLLQFHPCDQALDFVCAIPARSLTILDRENNYFNIDDQLNFNMQFSVQAASNNNSDDICARDIPGGSTFTISNEADFAILTMIAQGAPEHIRTIGLTGPEVTSTLFWVHDRTSQGCFAMILGEIDQGAGFSTSRPNLQSWPCSANLRVLCKFDKAYEVQRVPEMIAVIETSSGLIRQIGSDVLAHSDVIRLLGGLNSINPVVLPGDGQEQPIGPPSLQIGCDVPFLNTHQSVTIFRSGVPVSRREGVRFNEGENLVSPVDLSLFEPDDFPGSYNIIDSAATFSCEYNKANSARLLTSNVLFLRPTDLDILSLHVYVARDGTPINWPETAIVSMLNTWSVTTVNDGDPPIRGQRQAVDTAQFLQRLDLALADSGFTLKPIELRDFGPNSDAVLVMQAYQEIPNTNNSAFTDIPNNNQSLARLQRFADGALRDLNQVGVTRIEARSIDWCWATRRTVEEVGQVYQLPTTRAPGVWNSPEICARDNTPLVTVECTGNKFYGFSWGPTKVNSLCDYSDGDDEESPITDVLQELSQDPVTPDNVNTTVTKLKTLVDSVSPDDVTPTDVNYIADVIQKATTTGGDLDPVTVEEILETISDLSELPADVLEDGQRMGNSSNRLIMAADKVGTLVEIPAGTSEERIVNGGLALEVWDITQRPTDSNIIVGIKMLSDGSKETITYEELVSQFSDSEVVYDGTEAAIYLPEEFLRLYTNVGNNTDVRLSMNVYKLTGLYRDPSSIEEDGVNRTLNSRVIAAQLIVGGRQITDLGGYKVLTVFEPTEVVLPTDERPNRTTCVYWDFSANQGAGGWSTDGCAYGRTTEGRDVCECDHLTNFAVLVSFYDQSELEHKEILGYITIVGLSLSIAGLAMSMLSFIFIKKLRQGRPQQTLFQLSLALLLSWVVFLAGIDRTSDHDGCIAVAAILHYLILASFMWMLMEGLLQYLLFVRVMNSYFTHYMWKTSIPSWGLPVIPVVIILAIDTELYKGGDDYCWMDLDAFYYGFAIPVGLIILANLVVFILVSISLWRRKDMSKHSTQKSNQTFVNIRASFICFCVLGLSWIFGFLAIEDARLVFQYLFCIFASLQGFIVFLMMTARDKQVRQYWRQRLCCCCPDFAKGDSSKSATSNSKAGSMDPMRIPRVHSTKTKQGVSSFTTNNSALSNDSDANGDSYHDLMGQEQPSLALARRDSSGHRYGEGESVLF